MAARPAVLPPRRVATAATRRAILRAAEHLLSTHGEEGLSIRELCTRAGVTPPTVYHHFGDKQALVDRVVNDCFGAFDRALGGRPAPRDPVAALRWSFDRYLEYGFAHPTHYRLMFERTGSRPTPAGRAAYDRLRRMVAAVAASGRLAAPVEDATAACWCAAHGVTSLVVAGHLRPDAAAVALVRDSLTAHLITAPRRQRRSARQGGSA